MLREIINGLACGEGGCPCAMTVRRQKGLVHCPNHNDPTPSLNVEEKDGTTLVKCHGGCEQSAVIQALRDKKLWADHTRWEQVKASRNIRANEPEQGISKDSGRREVARYEYVNRKGEPNRTVIKYEPKAFSQRGPNGEPSVAAVELVLYHLPDVIAAVAEGEPVFIVEGEKDADNLRAVGICATTSPQGAGKWQDSFVADLVNADIVVVSDADEVGRKHAREVATSCGLAAKSIKVIELSAHDASDWLALGGTKDQLLALVEKAPAWDNDGRRILTGKDQASMYADIMAKRIAGDPDYVGVPTGLGALDTHIALRPGELVLIEAATSIGKSALMTTIHLDLDRRGIQSMYITLEMSWLAITDRMVRAGLSLEKMANRPGLLVDEPGLTTERLEVLCKVARLRGCRIIFVDYAQRIVGDKNDSEYERVSRISGEMARIARECRVNITTGVQVSRTGARADGSPPNLSDIRASGHLEEDADIVLALGRKKGETKTMVAINKNRNGGTGFVTLDFDKHRSTFTSWVKPSAPVSEVEEPVPWLPD